MKTAIYVTEGKIQVVLMPESDWEKTALKGISEGVLTVKRGSFYECQGGWTRQAGNSDDSIILLVDKT